MNVGTLYVYLLEVLAGLAFASWRFPFVYETGFVSLLIGTSLIASYVILSLVVFLVSGVGSDFYLHWAASVALGLGFVAHGCAALLFGKRLSVKEEAKRDWR